MGQSLAYSIAVLEQNKRWIKQLSTFACYPMSLIYHRINHPDWYVMIKEKYEL